MKRFSILIFFMIFSTVHYGQSPLFSDVSQTIGIDHNFNNNNFELGSGVAFIDINNDHYEDLFFTGGKLGEALYLNNQDGTFTNITIQAGIQLPQFPTPAFSTGVVSGDIDNDGFRDLLICTDKGTFSLLFRNLGNNTFQDITFQSGIHLTASGAIENQWSYSPSMGDINLDGFLDIYISNWVQEGKFVRDSLTNEIIGYANKGAPNRLYINNGDLTFTEMSPAYGLDHEGCSLVGIFSDYDNDRDPDVLIANDFGAWVKPDALFNNQYPVQNFIDKSEESGFNTPLFGMGIGVGDYDKDSDLDYYKTNVGSHVLLQNNNNGTFNEVAQYAGVQLQYIDNIPPFHNIGWGAGFTDLDNDSWLDLVVAQGALFPPDFFIPSRDSLTDKLFRNLGNGTFEDVSNWFETLNFKMSRGLAYGDYDNDGDIDLIFTCNHERLSFFSDPSPCSPVAYKNQLNNQNHWLKVKTVGTINNRDGFGTHLTIHVNGASWLHEIGGGGQGHNSQHSSVAHFGLGEAEVVDSLVVSWPGNLSPIQVFYDIPANHYIEITEGVAAYEVIQGMTTPTREPAGNNDDLQTFPNPIRHGSLSLNCASCAESSGQLRLFSPTGQLLRQTTINLPHDEMSIDGLSSGIYLLEVVSGQEVRRRRVVIQR